MYINRKLNKPWASVQWNSTVQPWQRMKQVSVYRQSPGQDFFLKQTIEQCIYSIIYLCKNTGTGIFLEGKKKMFTMLVSKEKGSDYEGTLLLFTNLTSISRHLSHLYNKNRF